MEEIIDSPDQILSPLCDSLLAILKKEIPVYRELEAAVLAEQQVMRRPSISAIDRINHRKETCLLKLRILEETRSAVVRKIARKLQQDEKDIHLSRLARLVDGARAEEIRQVQAELASLTGNIAAINQDNMHMIDISLQQVQTSLSLLANFISAAHGYSPGHIKEAPPRAGQVIRTRG